MIQYNVFLIGDPTPEIIFADSLTDAYRFAKDNFVDIESVSKSIFQNFFN